MADGHQVDGAFVDWFNVCNVSAAPARNFEDLIDGDALAALLCHFLPGSAAATTGSSASVGCALRLQEAASQLATHFAGRLELPVPGRAVGHPVGHPVGLGELRALAEACLLAAIEGPRKDEAVAAILALDEAKQAILKAALQSVMAKASGERPASVAEEGGDRTRQLASAGPGSGGGGYASRRRRQSVSPMPLPEQATRRFSAFGVIQRGSFGITLDNNTGSDDADRLRRAASELRAKIDAEAAQFGEVERTERVVLVQLQAAQSDLHSEEELASQTGARLAVFWRSHGEELRRGTEEVTSLTQELHHEVGAFQESPGIEARLKRLLDTALEEHGELAAQVSRAEAELQRGVDAAVDDSAALKAEMLARQFESDRLTKHLQSSELEEAIERSRAAMVWEQLTDIETQSEAREDELHYLRRLSEREEEVERDLVGILEFREGELSQLQAAVDRTERAEDGRVAALSRAFSQEARRGSAEASTEGPTPLLPGTIGERQQVQMELRAALHQGNGWQVALQEMLERTKVLEHQRGYFSQAEDAVGTVDDLTSEVEAMEVRLSAEHEELVRLRACLTEEQQVSEAATDGKVSGASEERPSVAASEETVKQLQDLLFRREVQLHILGLQCDERRKVLRGEARLLGRALQEVGLRFHEIRTRHRSLQEVRRLQAPPSKPA